MKYIQKKKEPLSLKQFRATPGASYDNLPTRVKEELKQSLCEEQGFICCYCMQRITIENMHIEHWKSQSCYPGCELDYKNLMAVCKGYERNPKHLSHCDKSKRDKEIMINPTDSNCEKCLKYSYSGEIDSDNDMIKKELKEILKLNIQTLVNNRRIVLDVVFEKLKSKNPDGSWSKAILQKELRIWECLDSEGKYKPYCQFVIFHLKKRLAKYA
jgi:uncharacterized protein (TIGR02646 family)